VLVFLPGVGEIRRCQEAVAPLVERQGHAVLPLFGDLPPDAQDRVLADLGCRKVILATNVAETSLTIPGVTAVVDSGLARQSRVAAATGLPRLELVPISKASADQRAPPATGRRTARGPSRGCRRAASPTARDRRGRRLPLARPAAARGGRPGRNAAPTAGGDGTGQRRP